ncbi:MAG: hypothetical protein A2751_05030 [Candidatus Doudnabacteria bacterium RIFCSPHIGHO2_01_FULL_46_14]|uniref:Uncharacterized protein n=1 Tax=Candidatus Doudnabacteria bacterium RIFCSPHIGHO2_01_FULL_46_14 TaxID=1817824 RepID=A0A1F5NP27_9BACT|nr:MAG: hypothetical protein A2751_05030 [Candidatus Doudnabacteria bacterium RIFCSPHIGHO2_01_FULL_46_14]
MEATYTRLSFGGWSSFWLFSFLQPCVSLPLQRLLSSHHAPLFFATLNVRLNYFCLTILFPRVAEKQICFYIRRKEI